MSFGPARNRILAALPSQELDLLGSWLKRVSLAPREILSWPEEPIEFVCFPEAGVTSLMAPVGGGHDIEVGMVGPEGMVGAPVVLGADRARHKAEVQIGGVGLRMSAAALLDALNQCPSLKAALLRYVQAFHDQVSQKAACNGRHHIQERLARWLLMAQDRSGGNSLPMTHEALSALLGVRRAGITTAVKALEQARLIGHRNGHLTILDRAGLEKACCECYRRDAVDSDLSGERSAPPPTLSGLNVLVVEDRYPVAQGVARMAQMLGCRPVGPAGSLKAGFDFLRREAEGLGAALLDVDLRGNRVYPLARALAQARVPIVFTTGYGSPAIAEEWRRFPRLEKPFQANELERALLFAMTHPQPVPEPGESLDLTDDVRRAWDTICEGRNVHAELLAAKNRVPSGASRRTSTDLDFRLGFFGSTLFGLWVPSLRDSGLRERRTYPVLF